MLEVVMALIINIYYTGKDGNAKKFAQEMHSSGLVDLIRKEEGNLGYDYFFPQNDDETVLLIDKWTGQEALDAHHKSDMMQKIAYLRDKYKLKMHVEQFRPANFLTYDEIIKKRSSTRKFCNKKLEENLLQQILQAGAVAPTARNLQPQKIFVLKSASSLKKVDKVTPCRYNAPLCLLICADKDMAYKNGDYSSFEMDATIVATHMMLMATNLGVDNIWIRNFNAQDVQKEFDLPDNIIPICIMPLGYKADDYIGSPNHNNRKPLSDTVTYL